MTRSSSNIAYMRFFTLIAAVILVGCSSASQTTTATTQPVVVTTTAAPTTTSEAPTTTIDPNIAEIEAVVRLNLRYLTDHAPTITVDDLGLSSIDPELSRLSATFAEWIESDYQISPGTSEVSITAVLVSGDSAEVEACFLDDSELINADGSVAIEADQEPHEWTLQIALTDNGWRVSNADYTGGELRPCDL